MKKQLCLISTLVVAGNLLSPAVFANPLADALAECRQQQNALKRLVCYDEINPGLTAAATDLNLATSNTVSNKVVQAHGQAPERPMPTRKPENAAAKAAPAKSDFGLEHKQTADKQADQLYLTVKSISYSPRKELIVEFDNGQIWRQNDSSYYDIKVGERHFIKRGMLSSFSLGNDDNNRTIKVRRVE